MREIKIICVVRIAIRSMVNEGLNLYGLKDSLLTLGRGHRQLIQLTVLVLNIYLSSLFKSIILSISSKRLFINYVVLSINLFIMCLLIIRLGSMYFEGYNEDGRLSRLLVRTVGNNRLCRIIGVNESVFNSIKEVLSKLEYIKDIELNYNKDDCILSFNTSHHKLATIKFINSLIELDLIDNYEFYNELLDSDIMCCPLPIIDLSLGKLIEIDSKYDRVTRYYRTVGRIANRKLVDSIKNDLISINCDYSTLLFWHQRNSMVVIVDGFDNVDVKRIASKYGMKEFDGKFNSDPYKLI
jgi:hypothetical protein